jgi:hypothetical protein
MLLHRVSRTNAPLTECIIGTNQHKGEWDHVEVIEAAVAEARIGEYAADIKHANEQAAKDRAALAEVNEVVYEWTHNKTVLPGSFLDRLKRALAPSPEGEEK